MRILHILSSVNPAHGGPMEGVRQRGMHLKRLGHHVEVVTLDDPGAPYLSTFPLQVHPLGPGKTGYAYSSRLVPWLRDNARRFDGIVTHGLWQYHTFATRQALKPLGVPYHVFTHGMLDPWFKHTYPLKHLKKWLYWPWADYRALRDAQTVLFTSEEERVAARRSFWLYRAHERVVCYGTAEPPQDKERLARLFLDQYPQLRGRRIILFLSRIHEKKGCDLLVDAFGRLAPLDPDAMLCIAGPDQQGLVPELQRRAQALGIADRICWPGMLGGDLKWGAFHAADAFILPSHQENFGIAVAEALACALPVLITDKVNIWQEVQADHAGLIFPDTLEGTTRALRQWLLSSPDQVLQATQRARASYQRRYTIDAMAQSLLQVLAEAPASPLAHTASA